LKQQFFAGYFAGLRLVGGRLHFGVHVGLEE
jgi:hypothetical protein